MTAHSPRVPGRSVWDPGAVDDGSRTMVDLDTGEIVEIPASTGRAARLAARAARHRAAAADRTAEQAERTRRGACLAREALPVRMPIGLERPGGDTWPPLTRTAFAPH